MPDDTFHIAAHLLVLQRSGEQIAQRVQEASKGNLHSAERIAT